MLLLTRFSETKREQLAHSVGNLTNVGARILGAIFTMMSKRENESYYYYGYYGDGGEVTGQSPRQSSTTVEFAGDGSGRRNSHRVAKSRTGEGLGR